MIYLIWLLRIIHIVGGVFWVGGTLTMTFFIGPTVGAIGESGQKFVGHLMNNLKFSNRMSIAAGSTVLAGVILYILDARAGSAWLRSSFAIGLGIGAIFALVGFITGIMIGRTTKAMAQLGAQFQGKPTPVQMTQMHAIQKQQRTYSLISVATLLVAVVFMAISRYLGTGL
jgi:flagellar biosynthesis protein FlhB